MSLLLTDTGFLLGFIVFLFAWVSVFYFFHRDSKSNKTPYQERIFRAKEHSLSDLEGPIKHVLRSGVDGASILIDFADFDFSLVFRKYIRAKGEYGIALLILTSSGSKVRVASLKEYCERNEISFTVVSEPADESRQYLRVDCGQHSENAYELVKGLANFAEIPDNAKQEYSFSGGYRLGELVDSPEQQPASPKEDHKVKQEAFQKRYGQSMSEALAFFLQAVSDILVWKGLIYSFLLSLVFWLFSIRANWSVLEWEVFGLLVEPKVFDLVCIAVFLANLLQIWTRGYWATKLALAGKDWSHVREPHWRVDPWSALRELRRQLRFRGILIALVAVLWIQF